MCLCVCACACVCVCLCVLGCCCLCAHVCLCVLGCCCLCAHELCMYVSPVSACLHVCPRSVYICLRSILRACSGPHALKPGPGVQVPKIRFGSSFSYIVRSSKNCARRMWMACSFSGMTM